MRDRKEDILPLTEHFLERFNREHGKSVAFSKDALDLLLEYRWTGNVRELENLVERVVVMSKAPVVRAQDLPRAIRVAASLPATGSYGQPPAPQASVAASAAEPPHTAAPREGRPRVEFLKAMEREELQTALASAGWVIARAAKDPRVDAPAGCVQDEEARAFLPVEEVDAAPRYPAASPRRGGSVTWLAVRSTCTAALTTLRPPPRRLRRFLLCHLP